MRSHYDFSKLRGVRNPYLAMILGESHAGEVLAKDAPDPGEILVLDRRISPEALRRLALLFGDMVKYVVDVRRGIIAIGGELHADAARPSS